MIALMVNGEPLTEARVEERMAFHGLPEYMASGMYLYLLHRVRPGSFMEAVLCNDLREAVACADDENGARLKEWVRFMYCELPANSWGSPELVRQWLAERRVE